MFSDDFALDVREAWRDAVLETGDADAAFATVAKTFEADIDDSEDAAVFWIALAAAQYETGRLGDEVRDRALMIIDRGDDLARWDDADRAKRAKVLERLRGKLSGPQPAPKRIRRPRAYDVLFDPGDVVLLRNPSSGRAGLVYVVDRYDSRTPAPVVELLIWDAKKLPTEEEMTRLPALPFNPRAGVGADGRPKPLYFVLSTPSREEAFGAHLGEVIAKGIKRPLLADWQRGALNGTAPCYTDYNESWPSLVKALSGSARRGKA